MRTLEEYVAMIPAAPPADIDRYLDALGRKPLAITSYRCISRDDAESRLDCEDFRADLRPSAAIRPAALWCSECESWYLAEYVPAYGVQVVNVEQDTIDKKRNGETMVCPMCGAQTQLRNVQELRYGRAAQDFIAVPTVAENCLVLTQWCIERHMYEGYRTPSGTLLTPLWLMAGGSSSWRTTSTTLWLAAGGTWARGYSAQNW